MALGNKTPVITLVSGQVDVEPWADEQEVTLDRIVGAFHLTGQVYHEFLDYVAPAVPIIKMGILVNEEVTQGIDPPELDLFNQETMEDYEWMWLYTLIPTVDTYRTVESTSFFTFHERIDIDTHNRRKIGQSDELNVYVDWRYTELTGRFSERWRVPVQ